MLSDYLFRARFRGFSEWDFFIRPRGSDKPFPAVLLGSNGSVHKVAHAVNHSHIDLKVFGQGNFYRFGGNEIGLSCHNTLAVARLRKFVLRPLPCVFVGDVVDYESVHKTLYKRGFSASDGTHDADVYVAVRSGRYIVI